MYKFRKMLNRFSYSLFTHLGIIDVLTFKCVALNLNEYTYNRGLIAAIVESKFA